MRMKFWSVSLNGKATTGTYTQKGGLNWSVSEEVSVAGSGEGSNEMPCNITRINDLDQLYDCRLSRMIVLRRVS